MTIPFYDTRLIAEIQFDACNYLRFIMERLAANSNLTPEELFKQNYELQPERFAIAGIGNDGDYTRAQLKAADCGLDLIAIDEAFINAWEGFEGCIVIDEPPQLKSKGDIVKLIAMLDSSRQIKVEDIPKPIEFEVYDWRRERNYPTLKQSLRNPHFKRKHRR